MAMRMTGMMSGMDTESIIQQLVAAKQTKVDAKKKEQTRLDWKQEAWKELNTKLKKFQSKYLSVMRFSDAYTKKVTKVSNSNAVSVITGESAVDGVQSLTVDKLAKTGYMTGGVITNASGKDELSALSKLSDIKGWSTTGDCSFFVRSADGTKELGEVKITDETTISDVLTQLKGMGLNATFDAKWKRFNISAKESGAANDFQITATDKNGNSDPDGAAALKALGLDSQATKTNGQDAQITLNGAVYTNTNNSFEINGLTFTALAETNGETVTVTTQQDTDGIYDMIKGFLKEYNELVNEMDKLYNAESTRGYEPLTDDEKEAMSEKEIEKWETKIKDSILRRDDNLSSVNSALQSVMASGIKVNGKTMYLFDFGIETLGYYEAEDNERHAYHIAGDPDDEYTMNGSDKLKSMIASDPNTVITFFSNLGKELYDKMSDMSKSVEGYRSFGNFYDDKKMKSDYDSYTSKIKELEEKLAAYEDKWYAKFSKMETALAKMQSNMSAVTGLLGG